MSDATTLASLRRAREEARIAHVKAEHAYVAQLRKTDLPRFAQETKDHVWVKEDRRYAKYICPDDLSSSPPITSAATVQKDEKTVAECARLFRQLALLCHPDKCSLPCATAVFTAIQKANEAGNLAFLRRLSNLSTDVMETWDLRAEEEETEEESQLKMWMRELWYIWFHDQGAAHDMLRELLVTPAVYALRKHVYAEIEKFRLANAQLMRENHKLRTSLLDTAAATATATTTSTS